MKQNAARSEKFVVVAFVDEPLSPQSVHAKFRDWPSYIPVVPAMQGYRVQASQRMSDFLSASNLGTVTATVVSKVAFGEDDKMPISLLEAKGRLNYIRHRLADVAMKNGTVPDYDRSREYIPHIVESTASNYCLGQEIAISELSVVSLGYADDLRSSNWKQVAGTILL